MTPSRWRKCNRDWSGLSTGGTLAFNLPARRGCASPRDEYVSRSVPSSAATVSRSRCPVGVALYRAWTRCWRFRPHSARLKGVEGVEEPIGGWQRDLVNEILAAAIARRSKEAIRRASTDELSNSVSGSARLTVSVLFRSVASKSLAPRMISSARPRPTNVEAFRPAASGMHSHPGSVGPVGVSPAPTRIACRRRAQTRCSRRGRSRGSSRC